jgi:alpha-beta hydrolase superfamily lysophospholipase
MHHQKDWKTQRVLVVLHGMGEHGGRYLHFPHYLQSWVSGVYCLDHRGHGRSEGIRGHIERFDLFAEDAALAIHHLDEDLRKRFGIQPEIHLFAHSMGGLIALQSLFQFPDLPIRSVTLSAPVLGIAAKVPKIKKIAGRIISKVWGSMQMTSEVDPKALSHDENVALVYQADRLVHKKITPQLFFSMESSMASMRKRESGLNYPLQLVLPMQDRVVDSQVSLEFYRQLKSREKSLKTYPQFFHESHNELGKEQLFDDLLNWLKAYSTVS